MMPGSVLLRSAGGITNSCQRVPIEEASSADLQKTKRNLPAARSENSQPDMVESQLTDAVHSLAVVFARRGVRHALIGGLAVGLLARPRSTKDADFILQV